MPYFWVTFITYPALIINIPGKLIGVLVLIAGGVFFWWFVRDPPTTGDDALPEETPATGFDDLAPVDDAEQSAAYLKALKWGLENTRIKNIAITGPYGSGKSSILETFRKTYPDDFHYLNISLASFIEDAIITDALPQPEPVVSEGEEGKVVKENIRLEQRKNEAQQLIELSILQQIFYKVKEAEIPDSRFKRISPLSQKLHERLVVAGLLSLTAGVWLFFPGWTRQLSFMEALYTAQPDLFILLPVFLLIPGTVWVLYAGIRYLKDTGFKKLKISSSEIEINPKSEASILNKYLDELVYFFHVTAYNVVFIEDLDRFNDPEIFTKLRELNLLLNSSGQIDRDIVFVYAVRDDLFQDDQTRTKFFDFIIPIIPVINWSNSFEKLKTKLKTGGFLIDDRFITAITTYIDDMRVLKNLYNELIVYQQSLDIPPERQVKLLAMIVYKNMYPHDFAALHEGKGIVAQVFAAAKDARVNLTATLEEKINAMRQQIKTVEDLVPFTIRDLRAAYILAIIDQLTDFYYFSLDNDKVSFEQLQGDAGFEALQKNKDIRYYAPQRGVIVAKYEFKKAEQAVYPGLTYLQREALLRQKGATELANLNQQLQELISEKNQAMQVSAAYLVKMVPADFPDITEDIKENRLLRYLVAEGYIDESYHYLISYFYPGKLGKADLKFLTYFYDRIPLEIDHPLEKPEGLTPMLAIKDYEQPFALNIGLLDHLLQEELSYAPELETLLTQLGNQSESSLAFIELYLQKGRQIPAFGRLLCRYWPGLWAFKQAKGTAAEKDDYLWLILEHAETVDLTDLNSHELLTTAINDRFPVVRQLSNGMPLNNLLEKLAELDVKFTSIEFNSGDNELDTAIVSHSLYQLNLNNINAVIRKFSKDTFTKEELTKANYTSLKKAKIPALTTYVGAHLNKYIPNVLLAGEAELKDAETDCVELYNHDLVKEEFKEKLAGVEATKITDLGKITDTEFYPTLFALNKVKPTWANVLYYFEKYNEIDENLVNYLDRNAGAISQQKLTPVKSFDRELTNALELAVIQDVDLPLQAYRTLLSAFAVGTVEVDYGDVEAEKVYELIRSGYMAMSRHNIDQLKKDHPPAHIELYMTNPEYLLKKLEEFEPDSDDLAEILDHSAMKSKQKVRLIQGIPTAVIARDRKLATVVSMVLAETNSPVKHELLPILIKQGRIAADKVVLLEKEVNRLHDKSLIRAMLTDIGGEYAKINSREKPKLPKNPLNERLTQALQDKQVISTFKIDDKERIIKINPKHS